MELWWLWHCGGCGVVIGVGVNGFLFFLGLLVYVIGVVIGVMVFFFFLFCFANLG